ncbi:hypothetical protein BT69DRAFT_1276853 [Atractiella rhizophila]|nr:hypothetical protein BT69DRAFT_1276853 [Atractiella rhizophila]
MHFLTSAALLALSLLHTLFASPLSLSSSSSISPRQSGPSGTLKTPYDGYTVGAADGIELIYTRVNGDQGYYTTSIDVDIIDGSSNNRYALARSLTSASKDIDISGLFAIPRPSGSVQEGTQVNYQLIVVEWQIGADGQAISFQSAAPTFRVQTTTRDQCAGRQPGNCGNTF